MAAVVVAPQDLVPPEEAETDESDDSDINAKEKRATEQSPQVNNNNLTTQTPHDDEGFSTAHTDSENEDLEEKPTSSKHAYGSRSRRDDDNQNEPPAASTASKDQLLVHFDSDTVCDNAPTVEPKPISSRPPTPHSARRSRPSSATKKLKGSCDEDEDSSSSDEDGCSEHKKDSYVRLKLRRKTLLKIEKFTDSDSRSREKMRSRALSPPSSSDEENLHIGWVAYPAGMSSPRIPKGKQSHHRQRTACACAQALKCIFSPVTKVCQKCRVNNKVWDSESLQEKLLDRNNAHNDAINQ